MGEENGMEKTRIYVGGLGEAVTGDDLRKLFSSLGMVGGMEIVRTKGRSFAYVDFVPSVSNSLSKLLSTYNGCVWKGGRLKLEKAKEHYLAWLKKEWEEDVQQATNPSMDVDGADKTMETSEKPKIDKKSDTRQLRLFFPRLGKVKSLPFSGTGKHKYSFRRVEAPALPLHFCDCEEHAGSCIEAERQFQNQDDSDVVMKDQEINIMNLVMKKLFEKENVSIVDETNQAKEESIHKVQKVPNRNDLPAKKMKHLSEEGEKDEVVNAIPGGEEDLAYDETNADLGENDIDFESDEDDLVINVLSKGNKRKASSGSGKKEIFSSSQELKTCSMQKSEDESVENAQKLQKKNDLPSKKIRKSLPDKENDGNEAGSNKPVEKRGSSTPSNVSDSGFKAQSTKPESSTRQSSTGYLWLQKSSWKALVGDKGKSSFSLSTILPNDDPIEEEEPVPIEPKMDSNIDEPKIDNTIKDPKMDNHIESENETAAASENSEEEHVSVETRMENNMESENEMAAASEDLEEEHVSAEPRMENNIESENEMVTASEISEEHVSVEPRMENNIESENEMVAASENLGGMSGEIEKDSVVAETQPTKTDATPSEYGRGSSWLHKSSWVQLVSEKNSGFSILDVLPGAAAAKEAPVEPNFNDAMNFPNSNFEHGMKPCENITNGKDTAALGVGKEESSVHSTAAENHVHNGDSSTPAIEKKDGSASKKAGGGDVKIGETCSFMRSAESLKEWANLKATLSRSRKRKSNDK